MQLLKASQSGILCAEGDFTIDPWRPVDTAVITHGHADHARFGSTKYLCHADTAPILRKRLGDVSVESLEYGEVVDRNGVLISLHPAGHVLGSAQVRVERRGEVWAASGDYKAENDGVSAPFEPVRCHAFITESTFGLPIYRWRAQTAIIAEINAWWSANAAEGRATLIGAYGLGKAQRILANIDATIGPIICHGAIAPINDIYRERGVALPRTRFASELSKEETGRALVIAPPSALGSSWTKRFGDYADAFASGWMQIRGNRRRRGVDRGFALSDHADWDGLLAAISATGAERIFATHGFSEPLTRYLIEQGYSAEILATEYGEEALEGEVEEKPTESETSA